MARAGTTKPDTAASAGTTKRAPPFGLRMGPTRHAEVAAWAADHGLTPHAAVLALIDKALAPEAVRVVERVAAVHVLPTRRADPSQPGKTSGGSATSGLLLGPVARKPGSMLKKVKG